MYNLSDVKRKLFDFFAENEVFHLEKDFNKIFLLSENPELEKSVIAESLKDFQASDIVVHVDGHGVNAWVLKKPLTEYSQTLELSANTIMAMVNTINPICDELGLQDGKVNPLAIRERDIENLILIIHNLTTKGTVQG